MLQWLHTKMSQGEINIEQEKHQNFYEHYVTKAIDITYYCTYDDL